MTPADGASLVDELSGDEVRFVNERLVAFNASQVPFTQSPDFIKLGFGIKDANGDLLGGITALLYCWKCLYIDVLWVSAEHQRKGYGSNLLTAVETDAKAKGCKLVHLDTFDFQAKDFYLAHGYEIFGELHDCPPAHKRFYLKKNLDR